MTADERAVHVDVVEDRHAREIRARVDAFIEHDIDADDLRARSDRRQGLSRIRWIYAHTRPARLRRRRRLRSICATAQEMEAIRRHDVEPRRTRTAMPTVANVEA